MILQEAAKMSGMVKAKLEPYCDRIQVAGSIRRLKPVVHDIDIVCIPNNQGQFIYALQELGNIKMGGQKLIRCNLTAVEFYPATISLDVYIATPENWATLLLIRTGSKEHNIKLCSRARHMGMVLHADGSGLFKLTNCAGRERRIAGDTEESIFKALELPYLPPWKRG
jgi:DNA polymerase (family 10)